MLACKSEIHPKAIDPFHASEMAAVYNVGLAECTSQSEEGKKRMRDCFSYLVKEVAKARSGRTRRGGSVSVTARVSPQLPPPSPVIRSTSQAVSSDVDSLEFGERNRPRNDSIASSQADSASSVEGPQHTAETAATTVTDRTDSPRTATTATFDSEGVSLPSVHEDDTIVQKPRTQTGSGYVDVDELWDKFFFAAVSGNGEHPHTGSPVENGY